MRLITVWIGCAGMSVGAVAAIALALWSYLPGDQRGVALALFQATGSLPYLLVLVALVISGFVAMWIVGAYFSPLARAAEATRLSVAANPGYRLEHAGPTELRDLLAAINTLAARHAASLHDVDIRIAAARADLEHEKNRLAVLMSELAQSVIVCNRDGQIVLYNEQARRLFSQPAAAPQELASGFIGLGRSLYALLPREPVEHAIDLLNARTQVGEFDPVSVFTTRLSSGLLVRVRVAPMAGDDHSQSKSPPPAGFVLLLEDVTQEVIGSERRDQILTGLVERSRASLASLRAATENLAGFPDMDRGRYARFVEIAVEESKRLSDAIEHASREHAHNARLSFRALETVRAGDLLAVIHANLLRQGYSVRSEGGDQDIWLHVDCHALVQLTRYLARRLHDEFRVRDLLLAASADPDHGYLDIGWIGIRISGATAAAWEDDPLSAGGEASSNTVRDILLQHGAELWHEMDRPSGRARFRIMFPLGAEEPSPTEPPREGRPVFYDFDLSAVAPSHQDFDDRPLHALAFTVFDTETTGLDPRAGDEIISIGAVRIVNGRVLTGEVFEQLIDPHRPLNPESTQIHGIRQEMLRGQPSIVEVLPRFHRFCADTALVGHNVAFDMRFLQLKEQAAGIAFRQPVLDTLLLSAVLYESIQDHRLEALAHRLGIEVVARHTAVGDALVTADVFLKMLPLLAERGIRTLRQAREAAGRTQYAKLRY